MKGNPQAKKVPKFLFAIPSCEQWRNWTLPNKAGYLGLWVGVFAIPLALVLYWLSTREKPLQISDINCETVVKQSEGLLVDLDEIKVTWKASGRQEDDVKVYLRNVDSKGESENFAVSSHSEHIDFPHGSYKGVLINRKPGETNRIMAIFRTSDNEFHSRKESLLHVGITVVASIFQDKLTLDPMIDKSIVPYYTFGATIAAPPRDSRHDYLTLVEQMLNGHHEFPIADRSQYDWENLKITYLAPGDRRVMRTDIELKRPYTPSTKAWVALQANPWATVIWTDTKNQKQARDVSNDRPVLVELDPGTYTFRFEHYNYRPKDLRKTLKPGTTTTVKMDFERFGVTKNQLGGTP